MLCRHPYSGTLQATLDVSWLAVAILQASQSHMCWLAVTILQASTSHMCQQAVTALQAPRSHMCWQAVTILQASRPHLCWLAGCGCFSGIKITQESPRGLRASLLRQFKDMPQELVEPPPLHPNARPWKRLVFAAAFFHAAVQVCIAVAAAFFNAAIWGCALLLPEPFHAAAQASALSFCT